MLRPCHSLLLVLLVPLLARTALAQARALPPPAPEVLAQVRARIDPAPRDGQRSVVIFDLDDTLFRNAYRTKRVLADWQAQAEPDNAGLHAAIEALKPLEMTYALGPTLDRLDIQGERRKAATDFWGKNFFSNRYVQGDTPCEGGPKYVQDLHKAGAIIVYLTGRDVPRMQFGTEQSLRESGYPLGDPRSVMMLKPTKEQPDVEFKRDAIRDIRKLGHVVGFFDNEPGNCNLMKKPESFPDALVVLFDTVHSTEAPPLDAGIPRVLHW